MAGDAGQSRSAANLRRGCEKSLAGEDSKLVDILKADHDATREFVSKPIGKSADNMYSYLALVQDDPTVQVVNNAQKAYVEHFIQGDPDWRNYRCFPLLRRLKSAGARTIRPVLSRSRKAS